MAGMKRFVTYIYSYEDKKKGSNTGFARFEIRGEDCRIEIHMRGIYNGHPGCRVYLFREDAGDIEGIMIGDIKVVSGNGDFKTVIKAEKIGESPFSIYDMEGLFLLGEDDRIFMSRWKEGAPIDVCKDRFRVWAPVQLEEEKIAQQPIQMNTVQQKPKEVQRTITGVLNRQMNQSRLARQNTSMNQNTSKSQNTPMNQNTSKSQNTPMSQNTSTNQRALMNQNTPMDQNFTEDSASQYHRETEENMTTQKQAEIREESENITATEIPLRNIFPTYNWANIWENLQKSHQVFTPFEDKNIICVRIELKDLRELPKQYWYLGNNSFLLHGFFNYRYLVIGKLEEDRWFIGIPGIYQHQERVMAAIFGFSEFIPTALSPENIPAGGADCKEKEKAETSDTGEPVNRFGFWYRYMEE